MRDTGDKFKALIDEGSSDAGVCAARELPATSLAGGGFLRRGGWFDPGLIHSSPLQNYCIG